MATSATSESSSLANRFSAAGDTVGAMIRDWRLRRRLSQLDLALEAGVSQRHLSFIESGRTGPSRDMVAQLAETLDVPLRDRNALFLRAGYAPAYPERPLSHPSMVAARQAVERVLKAHEPNPALAVDRLWRLQAANAAMAPLMALARDPQLVAGAFNVLRASLHPDGLAPYILDLRSWRDHLLHRLRQQIAACGDPELMQLEAELAAYPAPGRLASTRREEADAIALPLRLKVGDAVLSFITTVTVFGTPVDVTLSELALEMFFPADAATADYLKAAAAA